MTNQLMLQDITSSEIISQNISNPYYEPQCNLGSSSLIDIDGEEIINCISCISNRHDYFENLSLYHKTASYIKADISSISPQLGIETEITSYDEVIKSDENLEYNIFVKIPPIKKWTSRIKVKNIRKASPKCVEPESFYDE